MNAYKITLAADVLAAAPDCPALIDSAWLILAEAQHLADTYAAALEAINGPPLSDWAKMSYTDTTTTRESVAA